MDTIKQKKGWPLTLCLIAAVVLVSAAIIYLYHDAPGRLPVSAISDEADGIIVSWQNDSGIYTQCIDSSGQLKWQKGGMLISDCPPGSSFDLQSDGLGGAIITWNDSSTISDDHDDPAYFDPVPIHAQRVSAGGELLWSNTLISAGSKWQVIPDGTGGAIFAWDSYRTYSKALRDDYLRLQRIAPDGRRLWGDEALLIVASSPFRPVTAEETASGVRGTSTRSRPTYEGVHYIVTDGAGGLIVLWEEDTGEEDNRVYARRLDAGGNNAWPDRVLAAHGGYYSGSARSDGEGGVFFAFRQSATGATYKQHISGDGELLETGAYYPGSISDGLGGIIQVRVEAEPTTGPPWEKHSLLYVRRLDDSGQVIYPYKLVLTTPEKQQIHELDYAADGTGGIVLAWQLRKETVAYGGIVAQRLDAEGNICWGKDGTPVFTAPDLGYQGGATVIGDGSGNVIIVAAAGKGALSGDMVYAQHLDINGSRLWGDGVRVDR